MLEIKEISKSYGSKPALDFISISAKPGEAVAILGPSGSGKTTLLRIIAGLESPDSGSVSFAGDVWCSNDVFVQPGKRRVTMMFDDCALWPHMRVLKNLTFAMGETPRTERDAAAMRILETLKIAQLADRYPHQISAGEKRRVALGRLLASKKEVALLDEPFSSLNAELRLEAGRAIGALKAEGRTVVFVTHLEPESLEYSDRRVIISEGKLAEHRDK
jgi:ABC-type Fe3+/spermidine/putrescine transport system ATPase subunit